MMPIFIVDEDGAPVNASVRNVQRNSGEIQSWPARRGASSVSTRSMEASIPRALSDESPRKRLGLNCLRPLFSDLTALSLRDLRS